MNNGTRVEIISGDTAPIGLCGTIFWFGESKYERLRAGVRGDDGRTWWLDAQHLKETEAPAPEPVQDGPEPIKGCRVRWTDQEGELTGFVFWYGPNKFGPGMRVGVKAEDGETYWLNADWVKVDEVEQIELEAIPF